MGGRWVWGIESVCLWEYLLLWTAVIAVFSPVSSIDSERNLIRFQYCYRMKEEAGQKIKGVRTGGWGRNWLHAQPAAQVLQAPLRSRGCSYGFKQIYFPKTTEAKPLLLPRDVFQSLRPHMAEHSFAALYECFLCSWNKDTLVERRAEKSSQNGNTREWNFGRYGNVGIF